MRGVRKGLPPSSLLGLSTFESPRSVVFLLCVHLCPHFSLMNTPGLLDWGSLQRPCC